MRAKVTSLGDGLAVVIDRETASAAALKEGDPVDVAVDRGIVTIRHANPRYTLAELLEGTTPESYRIGAVDWGPDVGREAVD